MADSSFWIFRDFGATLGLLLIVTDCLPAFAMAYDAAASRSSSPTPERPPQTVPNCSSIRGIPNTKASTEGNVSEKQETTTFMNMINTRFIAARGGAQISLSCSFGPMASWHKKIEQGEYQEIMNSSRVNVTRNDSMVMMQIKNLQHIDNGIYYCKNKDLYQSCGTELKVMGISTYEQVQSRHNVKDAIILIQTILLVLFVSMPVLLAQGKGDRKDATGEDHTYEGLTVELADTYEDIGVYQDRPEKWDLGEHPCEE